MASSGLPYQPASPRIVMSVEAYSGCWIHHVTVETADRIDKALPGWIREDQIMAGGDVYPSDMHAFDMLKPELDISRQAIRKFNEKFEYAKKHYFAGQG